MNSIEDNLKKTNKDNDINNYKEEIFLYNK